MFFPQIHSQSRVQQQDMAMNATHPSTMSTMPQAVPNAPVVALATMPTPGTIDAVNGESNHQMGVNTPTSLNANANTLRNTILQNTSSPVGTNSAGLNGPSAVYTHSQGVPIQAYMYPQYPPRQLMNNTMFPIQTQMRIYPGQTISQASDTEPPRPWPMLENSWSFNSIPTQQQIYLPSLANLGTFSNRSLGSQSPSTGRPQPILAGTNPNVLSLFNQLSNGSQFENPTQSSG